MMLAALIFATLSTAAPASVPSAAATPLASAAPGAVATPSSGATPQPSDSPYVVPTSEAVPAPTGLPGNFALPSTWISRAVPSWMPRIAVAFWTSANSPQENVSVMRLDNYPGSMADYVAGTDKALAAMHAVVVHEGPNPKCPAGTSDLVEHSDVMFGQHLAVVQDAVLDGHAIYLATYTRLESRPVDPGVIAALGTFCPPPPSN